MISAETRKQFEAWAAGKGMALHLDRSESGLYVSPVTQNYMDCWIGSQAEKAAELEALRKEVASLRGSCKVLGDDLKRTSRRVAAYRRGLYWFVDGGAFSHARHPAWLEKTIASLRKETSN